MKDSILIVLGAVLISISGQLDLEVPLSTTDISGTWQTFAVLVFAFATNRKIGTLAVLLYLILGVLGAPVFADGTSGWNVLVGKTGGFLSAFLISAFIVGRFAELGWNPSFFKGIVAMAIGTLIILIGGTLYLSTFIGIEKAYQYGFAPFLLGAFIKIILGALVLPLYYNFIKKAH